MYILSFKQKVNKNLIVSGANTTGKDSNGEYVLLDESATGKNRVWYNSNANLYILWKTSTNHWAINQGNLPESGSGYELYYANGSGDDPYESPTKSYTWVKVIASDPAPTVLPAK